MEHYHVNIPKDFRDYSTENIKVYIYEPLDLSGTIKIVRSKIVILIHREGAATRRLRVGK